ncbi:hypothetical protein I316_06109 [Kwoniella heveanensis BCC8398]|uniref:Uncharacterized protein n=1 Tax=Kwoniella heveanensis BCC8398 TaxID=1296120 RepID=A0A1B9GMW0_9TREE|nr:hypothetical protein I316_06109 [Kwoniella heveanensis BCC8398]
MSNATVIQRRHLMALNRVLVPLLACLTTLFVLLPGLSGLSAKGVNYYWLRVDYGGGGGGHGGNGGNGTLNFTSDVVVREVTLRAGVAAASASGSEGGLGTGTGIGSQMQDETGVWDLGAFGACQHVAVGDLSRCEVVNLDDHHTLPPPHWGKVRDVLAFHLAAATTFFLTACLSSALFHFPESYFTKRWGTLIPLLNALSSPAIVMISDLCVAHSIEITQEVQGVQRLGVYWLGTASFPLSILWCLCIQLEGARKRLEAGDAKLIIEERKNHDDDDDDDDGWADKAGKAIWRAWPWNRDDEDDQAKKARVRNEKHRSSSSKYKGKVKAVKKGVENRSKRKEEV